MDKELLDLTYQVCDQFKAQTDYQRLLELKETIHETQEIKSLVAEFQKAKTIYEEAKAYGQYHPDLKRYQSLFLQAKVAMMSNDVVKEYKHLERTLQRKLDRFSILLAETVSKNIKHPREMNVINLEER